MIKLHQFQRAWGLPNASPFCMKVETWLRMARLPYESALVSNPSKLPKGKAPVIEDDGQLIADSTFIVNHLDAKHRPGLDDKLSERDRAIAHAFARMLEERYYWIIVYSRWIDDRFWPEVRTGFFGRMPPVVRTIVPWVARRGVKKNLHAHGLGRHSAAEIYALGREDLASVAAFLGDKPFFMGEEPTSVDAVVFAAIANTLWPPAATPLKEAGAAYPALEAYCQRMRARYFPEQKIERAWSPA